MSTPDFEVLLPQDLVNLCTTWLWNCSVHRQIRWWISGWKLHL